jgi:hypothetical protein
MTKSGALRGKPYLCGSRPSKPGVAGRLDSCTVSSLGATPLAPREGALMLITIGRSSSPGVTTSSLTGTRDVGAGEGDECWTTIEGVDATSGFLAWVRSELRREREWERTSDGGGDLTRGEAGQWGVLSPESTAEGDFKGRGALIESLAAVGGSCGMLADERARWMAAAERPGELALGPRLGLTSVLLLLERSAACDCDCDCDCDCERTLGPGGAAVLRGKLRAGEASREGSAELAGDGEPDAFAFSERSRASDWRRIEGICVAGVPCGACTTDAWLDVELSRVKAAVVGVGVGVGVVDDDDVAGSGSGSGSALSAAPVMLRKSPPAAAADGEVMFAAVRLLLAGALGQRCHAALGALGDRRITQSANGGQR